jgi:DNA-binding NtrC family response regulator
VVTTKRLTQTDVTDRPKQNVKQWLVRVGCAHAPLLSPVVIALQALEASVIGRDHRHSTDDPWMSGRHAQVLHHEGAWQLQDLGSSNGMRVFGEPRSSAQLLDGDLFETGGTFWRFRSQAQSEALPEAPFDDVLSSLNPEFLAVAARLRRVARTRVPIMLIGASGSGKEVLARRVHELSGRSGDFVAINAAAIQSSLIASELFGVNKGAHSMAEQSRLGLIRQAESGSLLLDEIGDMPVEVQTSILRLLQESEITPVGGDRAIKVDARFICATHQDLEGLIESGRFRGDLYARLKGCRLHLPDLADRSEDIGILIARFLKRFAAEAITFSPAAYRALMMYDWPYNIRELERAIESAIAIATGGRIDLEDLPKALGAIPRPKSTQEAFCEEDQEAELRRLLESHHGNISAVARSAGRSRMQVHRWLKRFDIDPATYRK